MQKHAQAYSRLKFAGLARSRAPLMRNEVAAAAQMITTFDPADDGTIDEALRATAKHADFGHLRRA